MFCLFVCFSLQLNHGGFTLPAVLLFLASSISQLAISLTPAAPQAI